MNKGKKETEKVFQIVSLLNILEANPKWKGSKKWDWQHESEKLLHARKHSTKWAYNLQNGRKYLQGMHVAMGLYPDYISN